MTISYTKKILLAQQFILEWVYRITTFKLDAFQWKVVRDEIYQLIIYRNGMKSVLTFSEEELVGYGSKGWINRILMKIKDGLNSSQKI